jgi:hypothetical protein
LRASDEGKYRTKSDINVFILNTLRLLPTFVITEQLLQRFICKSLENIKNYICIKLIVIYIMWFTCFSMSLTNFFLDITVLMAYTLLKYYLSATKLYLIFWKFQQMIQFSEYVLKTSWWEDKINETQKIYN